MKTIFISGSLVQGDALIVTRHSALVSSSMLIMNETVVVSSVVALGPEIMKCASLSGI